MKNKLSALALMLVIFAGMSFAPVEKKKPDNFTSITVTRSLTFGYGPSKLTTTAYYSLDNGSTWNLMPSSITVLTTDFVLYKAVFTNGWLPATSAEFSISIGGTGAHVEDILTSPYTLQLSSSYQSGTNYTVVFYNSLYA